MDAQYSALIEKVLTIKPLQEKIQDFATADDETLNLVTPDWKNHLTNNLFYQQLQQDAKNYYSLSKLTTNRAFRLQYLNKKTMTVLFLGYCNVYKPYEKSSGKLQHFSVTVKDTPVLDELNKAFHSDLNTDKTEISDTAKVNFSACSAFCHCCSGVISNMAETGIHLQFDCINPCIMNTYAYDGKKVVNRFASQINQMLPGTFLGILKVEFNLRYFYKQSTKNEKNCVRTGGNALKLIAFPESNLKELNEKVDLGDLSIMTQFSYEKPTVSNETPNEGLKRSMPSDDEDDLVNVYPSAKYQKKEENEFLVTEGTIVLE